MKKSKSLKSLLLIIIAAAFMVSGFMTPAIMMKEVNAAEEGFSNYIPPIQNKTAFTHDNIGATDVTNWSPTTGNTAIAQTLDTADFETFVSSNSLKEPEGTSDPDYDYWKVSPTPHQTQKVAVLSQKTPGVKAIANYTASEEITLSADAYYAISVRYYVLGDEPSSFYLTDTTDGENTVNYRLPLAKQSVTDNGGNEDRTRSSWQDAYFFVKTDLLKTSKIRPGVYLGQQGRAINGVAYFYDFKIQAMSESYFYAEFKRVTDEEYTVHETIIDLTGTEGISAPIPELSGIEDSMATGSNAYTEISAASVVSALNFIDRNYFWGPNSGDVDEEVMLAYANQSYSGIKLNQRLKPEPHEIYLITFYTIAGSADMSSNYFRMGDDYQPITPKTYQYHNGWQLNTFFYFADSISYNEKPNSEWQNEDGYLMGFYVGQEGSISSGWMAISNFSVRKVSGDYYDDHSTSGTQVNFVTRADTVNPANANFNIGSSSDYDNVYPLKAKNWTVATSEDDIEHTDNGIINTLYTENLDDVKGSIPPEIGPNSIDNNIYMLRNTGEVYNEMNTTFTATINATNYISFDAYANDNLSKAVIKYNDGIIAEMPITKIGEWHRYEFEIAEATLATVRTYTFAVVREDKGETYIDNVLFQTTASTPSIGLGKTTKPVDITNPVKIEGAWKSSNQKEFTLLTDNSIDGISIMNNGSEYTEIESTYTYDIVASGYYKMTIMASGENAHLGATGFDGFVTLIPKYDDINDGPYEYNLYFYVEETGTVTLTIKFGKQQFIKDEDGKDTKEKEWVSADGEIFIKSMMLTKYEDSTEFDAAKEELEDNDEDYPKVAILSVDGGDGDGDGDGETPSGNWWDSFGKEWWYLIPTIITAVAIVAALTGYLMRKMKFNKHITRKDTSYARDMKIEKARKKILATRAAKQEKIDNNEESSDNKEDDTEERN